MIYVHVPFCKSFCTYCDFYSEICAENGKDVETYLRLLEAEIKARSPWDPAFDTLRTLYIGGGTPSVLPSFALRRIFELLPPGPYEECTVEVNPEDIVRRGLPFVRELRELGVTRVSMGLQSLSDDILRWMNRRHTADRGREAFHLLRSGGIGNISVDLIFGLSQLSLEELGASVRGILALGPDHLSAYQLSIEAGSALAAQLEKGQYREASEEQAEAQYRLVCRLLSEAGYRHYEISSWALPGMEALHNQGYWKRIPYIGFGPGAHSFDGRVRRWNTPDYRAYHAESEYLDSEAERIEKIMLSLRTDSGIAEAELPAGPVRSLLRAGALERQGARLRIPEKKWFVSDEIIQELI